MTQKFTFTLDRDRGLVRITMHGFWGLRDVAAVLPWYKELAPAGG